MMRRIGIDFDNTIICYDDVFVRQARARGWAVQGSNSSKASVRDSIRQLSSGDEKWQELQAAVYGPLIGEAEPFEGVTSFLRLCRARGWLVFVVSHKTEFAHRGDRSVKLTDAALGWMAAQGLIGEFDGLIDPSNVYFEPTRAGKISKIAELGCTDFIDDLSEIILESTFPAGARRILFRPDAPPSARELEPWTTCRDWQTISETLLVPEHRES